MSLLTKIQNKTQKEKLTLIWIVAGVVGVLMIAIWVLAYRYNKQNHEKIFNNIGSQVKDEQKFYEDNLKGSGVEMNDKYKFFK